MRLSKRALGLAISLHCAILLLIMAYFYQGAVYSVPAQPLASVETAYLAKPLESASQAASIAHSQSPPPLESDAAVKLHAAQIAMKAASRPTPLIPAPSSASARVAPLAPQQLQQLLSTIAARIQKNLHYPDLAKTHIEQGRALLQFTLLPDGELQAVRILQSSGVSALDQAALNAVSESSPVRLPDGMSFSHALSLRLPVDFSLR